MIIAGRSAELEIGISPRTHLAQGLALGSPIGKADGFVDIVSHQSKE